MLPFARVAIIGMGLIGSSMARAVREAMPTVRLTVTDGDAGGARTRARRSILPMMSPTMPAPPSSMPISSSLPCRSAPWRRWRPKSPPNWRRARSSPMSARSRRACSRDADRCPARHRHRPRPSGGGHREQRPRRRLCQPVQGPLVHPDPARPRTPTRRRALAGLLDAAGRQGRADGRRSITTWCSR